MMLRPQKMRSLWKAESSSYKSLEISEYIWEKYCFIHFGFWTKNWVLVDFFLSRFLFPISLSLKYLACENFSMNYNVYRGKNWKEKFFFENVRKVLWFHWRTLCADVKNNLFVNTKKNKPPYTPENRKSFNWHLVL